MGHVPSRDDRKRMVREWQDAQARDLALSSPRDPRAVLSYPSLGARLIGLLVIPSFEAIEAWDVHASAPGSSDLAVYGFPLRSPAT
jgi:hypothetical protein